MLHGRVLSTVLFFHKSISNTFFDCCFTFNVMVEKPALCKRETKKKYTHLIEKAGSLIPYTERLSHKDYFNNLGFMISF